MATPQGYQGIAEGYLKKSGDAYGSMGSTGSALSGLGQAYGRKHRLLYAPLERQIVRGAELDGDDLVDQAGIDTNLAFNKARGIQERRLGRMGVNPNSGRFRGLQQQLSLAQAAAEAGAKTRARRSGRRESFGRMMQAAGLGQQLPGLAMSGMRAGGSLSGAGAGGLRAIAGDYGSLAASSEQAGIMARSNFQSQLDALFGGGGADWANQFREQVGREKQLAWRTKAWQPGAMPKTTQKEYTGAIQLPR